jgi:hypothetical protein
VLITSVLPFALRCLVLPWAWNVRMIGGILMWSVPVINRFDDAQVVDRVVHSLSPILGTISFEHPRYFPRAPTRNVDNSGKLGASLPRSS